MPGVAEVDRHLQAVQSFDGVDVPQPEAAIAPGQGVIGGNQSVTETRGDRLEHIPGDVLQPGEAALAPDSGDLGQLGEGLERHRGPVGYADEQERLTGATPAQEGRGPQKVAHFPMAEGQGMAGAVAVAAEVEGQHVQPQPVQDRQQAGDVAAVPAVTVAKDDVAARLRVRHQPAAQRQPVGSFEADLLESQAPGGWVALGNGVEPVDGHQRGKEDRQSEGHPADPPAPVRQTDERLQQEGNQAQPESQEDRLSDTYGTRPQQQQARCSQGDITAAQGKLSPPTEGAGPGEQPRDVPVQQQGEANAGHQKAAGRMAPAERGQQDEGVTEEEDRSLQGVPPRPLLGDAVGYSDAARGGKAGSHFGPKRLVTL